MTASLLGLFRVSSQAELLWVVFGFAAQLLFTGRFLIQWLASEKARKSVMPVAFWYFSMIGGVMLLAYAVHRRDPVFILGQALGVFIYARNLWLIHRESFVGRFSGPPLRTLFAMDGPGGWFAPAFVLVAAVTLLRWTLLVFNRTDLFMDEAQYWLWGQGFEPGYYSKPPMIAWTIGAVTTLAGSDAPFWVRMPGAAFHAATALVLGALADRLYGKSAGFWTAAAYVTLPAVGFGSLMFTTDTVMAPFFAAALFFHRRLVEEGRVRDAALAGLMAGLACLSKYAGVYFLIGVAVAAAWRRDMRMPWSHAALMLLVCLLVLSPNLLWNLWHDGATFSHTADNIGWVRNESLLDGLDLAGALEFVAAQFAVMGPVLFAVLIAALVARRDALAVFVLPVLAIVTLQAFVDRAIANWAASAYLAGTVLAVRFLEERPRLRAAAIGLNAALCVALPVLTVVPVSGPGGEPLLARYLGREALSLKIIGAAKRAGGVPVVADNRSVLADLFYTGRDAGIAIYALPPKGRPMNHYQQRYPLPAGLEGRVLLATAGAPPACAGEGTVLDTAGGAYAGRNVKIYLTDAACVASWR